MQCRIGSAASPATSAKKKLTPSTVSTTAKSANMTFALSAPAIPNPLSHNKILAKKEKSSMLLSHKRMRNFSLSNI